MHTAARKSQYKFREKQRLTVVRFVRGNDVFVSLPTGSGNSLYYSCREAATVPHEGP